MTVSVLVVHFISLYIKLEHQGCAGAAGGLNLICFRGTSQSHGAHWEGEDIYSLFVNSIMTPKLNKCPNYLYYFNLIYD